MFEQVYILVPQLWFPLRWSAADALNNSLGFSEGGRNTCTLAHLWCSWTICEVPSSLIQRGTAFIGPPSGCVTISPRVWSDPREKDHLMHIPRYLISSIIWDDENWCFWKDLCRIFEVLKTSEDREIIQLNLYIIIPKTSAARWHVYYCSGSSSRSSELVCKHLFQTFISIMFISISLSLLECENR